MLKLQYFGYLNSQLIGKDPNAGKDWRQREKRVAEDKKAGEHHWFSEHQLGQTPGDSEGQGSLTYRSPQGCKELDPTQWLNNKKTSSETYYNQTFKRQTEKHWSIKREARDHIHGILNKISSRLLMGNFWRPEAVDWYIQYTKIKTLQPGIQYPPKLSFRSEGEIKTFLNK